MSSIIKVHQLAKNISSPPRNYSRDYRYAPLVIFVVAAIYEMTTPNRDVTLGVSVVLSTVSLVLLLVVTCYFQTSLRTLEQRVELDKELLLQLQEQVKVSAIKAAIAMIAFPCH